MPLPGVHLHLPTPQAPDQRWLPLPAGRHQLAQPAGPRSPPGLLCLGDCEPTGVSPAPLLMTAGHPPGPPAPACAVRSARCPPTPTLQVSPPADPVGRPCRTCSPCLPSEVTDHGHCPARSTTRPSSCPPQRPLEHRDTKSTLPPRLSPGGPCAPARSRPGPSAAGAYSRPAARVPAARKGSPSRVTGRCCWGDTGRRAPHGSAVQSVPFFPRATLRVHRCHWRARPRHGRRVCPPPPAAFRQDRRPWSPRLRAAGAPASTCVRAGRSGRVSGTPAAWPSPSPRRRRSGPSEPNFRSGCSATSQVPSRERVERRVPERCRPAGLAPAHHSAARAVAEHARGHSGRTSTEAGRALAPTGRVPGGYAGAWRAAGPGAPG